MSVKTERKSCECTRESIVRFHSRNVEFGDFEKSNYNSLPFHNSAYCRTTGHRTHLKRNTIISEKKYSNAQRKYYQGPH
jgi:hypothetical protein